MNEYEKRVLEGRKQFLRLTQQQEKELLEVYEEAAKRTVLKTLKSQTGTLTDRYLRELDKALVDYTKYLRANLDKVVKNTTKESAKIASNVQNTYMDMIAPTQDLKSSFNKMFTQLSDNVVKQLIGGKYYEDGKTLDKRLWNITEKNGKDIDKLIKVNIAQGTNAKELAKELQQYINPDKPLTAKTFQDGIDKNVSYQARRLARTSLTHAHSESYIQGSKMNPFSKGLKWNLSPSHSTRMHGKTDICDERATQNEFGLGQGVFPADECPIQHCNCLCYFTQEVIDVNKARDELIDWLNGEDNPKLDNWLDEFGEEFGIEKSESKPLTKINVTKDKNKDIIEDNKTVFKEAKTVKEAEKFAKNTLGVKNVSYKGCDVKTANEWNRGIHDAFEKFPELKKNFGFVGECHERNKLLKEKLYDYYLDDLTKSNPKVAVNYPEILQERAKKNVNSFIRKYVSVNDRTLAQSWSPTGKLYADFKGITVNKKWGKDSEKFIAALKNDIESKFHPEYCDTIRSVLDHEVGHQLDNLLGIGKIHEVQKLFNDRSRPQLTRDISSYSWDNKNNNLYSEMIAEAWAEYCNSPKPREIARTIGEIIEKTYKSKFGR